jgi:SET domain-containing protein
MWHSAIVLQKSPIHGFGLFATKPIRKGEITWKGPINEKEYSVQQIQQWPAAVQNRFFRYAYQVKKNRFRGPKNGVPHDIELYMNHSCNPTVWFCNDNLGRARKNIRPGQEITYDYETSEVIDFQKKPMHCHCGSGNCRKTLTGFAYRKKSFQKKYAGHLLRHVQELIRKEK